MGEAARSGGAIKCMVVMRGWISLDVPIKLGKDEGKYALGCSRCPKDNRVG